MLQNCQMHLLRYMCSYPCLDYDSCLEILNLYMQTGDRTALSYAFRPLTKNGYLSKGKDGLVTICAKGRALFPDITPLVTVGGTTRERVAQVARVALLLAKNDIQSVSECRDDLDRYFIPSACWRKIAPGILSTTRFAGMLMMDNKRYAVYDVGGGHMEWQVRAESSLFYTKYGNYKTRANGMILICNDDTRTAVAENIIRQTMWNRKQLLKERYAERNKPTRWSRSPIKLRRQYKHVYLTTPSMLAEDLKCIAYEDAMMEDNAARFGERIPDPTSGDYEDWPTRYFDNPATDLLKYVYFFACVSDQIKYSYLEYSKQLTYVIFYRPKDEPILRIYGDMLDSVDWVQYYVYTPSENDDSD